MDSARRVKLVADPPSEVLMSTEFDDAVLGKVREARNGSRVATPMIAGREVRITIEVQGEDVQKSLDFARALVGSAQQHDRSARDVAAVDLLDTYNDNWREYQEIESDGAAVDVSNPELSAEEFVNRLILVAVHIWGENRCEFFYNDGGLFWGHSVVVTTRDAGATWTDAQLFG